MWKRIVSAVTPTRILLASLAIAAGAIGVVIKTLANSSVTKGTIILGSPTIYTRQRLVNDRLEQTSWLRDQLSLTQDDKAKDFLSIDAIVAQRATETASLRASNESQGTAKNAEKNSTGPGAEATRRMPQYGIEQTTLDRFIAMNNFRDQIRTQLMQTSLDDRHDIKGNTLYRLAFDATVLAGKHSDQLAVVKINLTNEPRAPENDRSYIYTYDDWVDYIKDTVRRAVLATEKSIAGPYGDPLNYPGATSNEPLLLLPVFANFGICKALAAVSVKIRDLLGDCDQGAVRENSGYSELSQAIEETARRSIVKEWQNYKNELLFVRLSLSKVIDDEISASRSSKPSGNNNIPVYDKTAVIDQIIYDCSLNQNSKPAKATIQVDGQIIELSAPCQIPPATISDPIWSILKIYFEIKMALSISAVSTKDVDDAAVAGSNIKDWFDTIHNKASRNDYVEMLEEKEQKYRVIDCIAAEFYKWLFTDYRRWSGKSQFSNYLNLDVIGWEDASCEMKISKRPESLVDGPYFVGKSHAPSDIPWMKLRDDLNMENETFVYSVEPKNFIQHVSETMDARQIMELDLSGRGEALSRTVQAAISAGKDREQRLEEIQDHAVILPLGEGVQSATGAKREGPYSLFFGWVIAPRIRGDKTEHIDGVYPLAAVISVPSWWQSVNVDYSMCWISSDSLEPGRKPGSLWDPETIDKICDADSGPPRHDVIRLPYTESEISRKLGFELIPQPQLDDPQQKQILRVGHPGDLLLTGGRLWRGSEVYLNSQKANRITVLPDMNGIVAHFNCVLPGYDPGAEGENGHDAGDDGENNRSSLLMLA